MLTKGVHRARTPSFLCGETAKKPYSVERNVGEQATRERAAVTVRGRPPAAASAVAPRCSPGRRRDEEAPQLPRRSAAAVFRRQPLRRHRRQPAAQCQDMRGHRQLRLLPGDRRLRLAGPTPAGLRSDRGVQPGCARAIRAAGQVGLRRRRLRLGHHHISRRGEHAGLQAAHHHRARRTVPASVRRVVVQQRPHVRGGRRTECRRR